MTNNLKGAPLTLCGPQSGSMVCQTKRVNIIESQPWKQKKNNVNILRTLAALRKTAIESGCWTHVHQTYQRCHC